MPIREIKFKLRVIVEPDGDDFHAYAPDLRGLHAVGNTESEALAAIREGAALYIQSLAKHEQPIPMGMVLMDRNHDSVISFLRFKIMEKWRGTKGHCVVEEFAIPTNSHALAS